jgi:hypothetical protein
LRKEKLDQRIRPEIFRIFFFFFYQLGLSTEISCSEERRTRKRQ